MVLLDSNVCIYFANGHLMPDMLRDAGKMAHASISKVEALGYHHIRTAEKAKLTSIFQRSQELELTAEIVDQAVRLRQQKAMSLGDAVIAATALVHRLPLWTANTDDFQQIAGLRLVNPFEL